MKSAAEIHLLIEKHPDAGPKHYGNLWSLGLHHTSQDEDKLLGPPIPNPWAQTAAEPK